MFVKPFRYERVDSLHAACELLRGSDGYTKVIAGGQSLMPLMNLGILQLDRVIDISRVPDARGVTAHNGFIDIGPLTRHAELVRDPILLERQPLIPAAAGWIGSPRIRSVGTLGGSLVHSDPAAELPLVMVALGAEYTLLGVDASRVVRADEFHATYFTTTIGEDELLASARVPALGPEWGWSFAEVSRRRGDFALAAAAVLVRVSDGRVVESRVALGGVHERPLRIGSVEAAVLGASKAEIPDRVGPIEGIEPVSDTSATAEHRARLAGVLTLRALVDAFDRAEAA